MEQTELPFKNGLLTGAEEFELWMKDEDERMKGGEIKIEKNRQVGVNPDLFIRGNSLYNYSLRPKVRHNNGNPNNFNSLSLR